MTNQQLYNLGKVNSFAINIDKLSRGRSTKLSICDKNGDERILAKVTCDTVGQFPRKFTVRSASGFLPEGCGYTYKRIMSNLFSNISLTD